MKTRLLLTIMILSIGRHLFGQTLNLNFEQRFTPSASVGSLGAFGGSLDVKKSTGGLDNAISLFSLKEGTLNYSPAIEYFSTGVKVNDWGGRLGIDWSENFTCVIYRTVKSVPDEKATSRVDDDPSVLSEINSTNFTRVDALATSAAIAQGKDGEYDVYSYNLFGQSGSFIIKDSQAVLLNHSQPVKIDILSSNPYKFQITKTNGEKYYFGLNSEIEIAGYDSNVACELEPPVFQNLPSAWFLTKIESPLNGTINFSYGQVSYNYVYDVNEQFVLKYSNDIGDDLWRCPGLDITDFNRADRYFCHNVKYLTTFYLTAITATQFRLAFEYFDRNDIPGEKLYKKISLYDAQDNLTKTADFTYNLVTATSIFETELLANLGVSTENDNLRRRYFLATLKIGLNSDVQTYGFEYNSPQLLPHRFSFSQDIAGYYNGLGGAELIPYNEILNYAQTWPKVLEYPISTSNRLPTAYSGYGLLKKITYPTKGYDQITFEPNTYTDSQPNFVTLAETLLPASSVSYWDSSSENFDINFDQKITLNIRPDYYGTPLPREEDRDLYYIEFQLWDVTHNHYMAIPGMNTSGWVTKHILENYLDSANVFANTTYRVDYHIYNYHTYVTHEITYGIEPTPAEKIYYGNRVAKIESFSGQNPKMTRTFNYKHFTKTSSELVYDNQTAITIAANVHGFIKNSLIEFLYLCGGEYVPLHARYHYFKSKSDYFSDMFNGYPYTYNCVTEYTDSLKTSFIASEFSTTSNEDGSVLIGEYTPFIPLSNRGWNNGLEINRYYGAKIGASYKLTKEMNWHYSPGSSTTINNYVVHKEYNPTTTGGEISSQFLPYTVMYTPMYSRWYKLDYVNETDYRGGGLVSLKKDYSYNSADKLLSDVKTLKSDGEQVSIHINRPNAMVSAGHDPTGVYQAMINKYIVEPEIENINFKGVTPVQTGLIRTNYYQPYTDIFVPQSVETQAGATDLAEMRFRYHNYDAKGNLLCQSRDNGPKTSYVWSYGWQFPIAEIKNADYATVQTALGGATAINTFAADKSATAWETFLAPLRSNSSLSKAQVTTFLYYPLAGIRQIIDPKTQATYYEYDSVQRLMNIKDQYGNIVKHIDYHYSNQ